MWLRASSCWESFASDSLVLRAAQVTDSVQFLAVFDHMHVSQSQRKVVLDAYRALAHKPEPWRDKAFAFKREGS